MPLTPDDELPDPDIYPSETDLLLDSDGGVSEIENNIGTQPQQPAKNYRNLVAYWLLGLCNNFGYVVMLSAAHDILSSKEDNMDKAVIDEMMMMMRNESNPRDCNKVSTGAVLLADILPALCIKLIAPFLPFFVHFRIAVVIMLSSLGFILVAVSKTSSIAILGVVATSLASGLGEVTFMSYSSKFDANVVSTWASGTGGAGVFGSFSYAGLTSLGLTPETAMYIMLVVPCIMGFSFWGLLNHPHTHQLLKSSHENDPVRGDRQGDDAPLSMSMTEKLSAIPPLLKFMIPLCLVYFFEYFINQGLYELLYFTSSKLDHHEQYRWYQVDYQIGVFVSRSSVNIFQIKRLWILALLQGLNVLVFTYEVVTYFVPAIWIIFIAVFWEGLLGGASYVNTFYQISRKVPSERKEFSLGITCLSDAVGIALAGFASIPAHNFLCDLPLPDRP